MPNNPSEDWPNSTGAELSTNSQHVESEAGLQTRVQSSLHQAEQLIAALGSHIVLFDEQFVDLIEELEEVRPLSTELLISDIKQLLYSSLELSAEDESILYNKLTLLSTISSPESEAGLTQLLNDSVILSFRHRSYKLLILQTLSRVGTLQSTTALRDFAHSIHSYSPYDESDTHQANWARYDIGEAQQALYAIAGRNTEHHDIQIALDAIQELDQIMEQRPHESEFLPTRRNEYYWGEDDDSEWEDYEFENDSDEWIEDNDVDEDQRLAHEFNHGLIEQAKNRIDVLQNLYEIPSDETPIPGELVLDPEKLIQKHKLEFRESNPSPLPPTMGIEIEIREKAILPPAAKQWTIEQKGSFLHQLKDQYNQTAEAGIPTGHDAFWEFAHEPSHNYLTLSREVQWLVNRGFIPQERGKHSLHLTLGGITSTGEAGSSSYSLARALEATG